MGTQALSAVSACPRRHDPHGAPGPAALSRCRSACHGYATEAAREALRVGFDELGLPEITSFTVPQNVRSRAVMERIGLIHDPDGDFDHPRVDPVAYPHLVRHVPYRLGRATWESRRAAAAR